MKKKKEQLIIQGNELYEIDLECIEKKQKIEEKQKRNAGKEVGNAVKNAKVSIK